MFFALKSFYFQLFIIDWNTLLKSKLLKCNNLTTFAAYLFIINNLQYRFIFNFSRYD